MTVRQAVLNPFRRRRTTPQPLVRPPTSQVTSAGHEHEGPAGAAAPVKRSITLGQGTVIIFAIQALATIVRYVSQVMFARGGGARNYGYYAYSYSWVFLLSAPVALGFSTGTLKFLPAYAETGRWAAARGLIRRSIQLTWLASLAVTAMAAAVILPVFGIADQRGATLMLAFAILPLAAVVNLQKQFPRAHQSVAGAYGIGELLPPVVVVALTLPLLVTHVHLTGVTMLGFTAAGFLVALPVQALFVRRVFPNAFTRNVVAGRRPEGLRPEFETRTWLRVALPLLGLVTLTNVMNYADVLIVGSLRSATDTGLYSAANRLANLVSFVLGAVNGILAPMVVVAWRSGDKDRLHRLMRSAVKWTFVPSLVCVLPMLVVPGPLLSIFGRGFAGAATPLRLLAIAQLVNAAAGPVGLLLALTGQQDVVAAVCGVALVAGLVLYLLLIPTLGIEGAAIGSAVTTIVTNVWLYILVRRRYQMKLYGFV